MTKTTLHRTSTRNKRASIFNILKKKQMTNRITKKVNQNKDMKSKFEKIIEFKIAKIKDFLQTNGIFIQEEIILDTNPDENHRIDVNVYKNEEKIGECNSILVESTINPNKYSFRNATFKTEKCQNISWIEVKKKNLGIGTFILIYCIFICYKQFPAIQYCVLDNDSDRSTYLKGDIYKKIGFSFINPVSFDHSKPVKQSHQKIQITGPEMQYLIDNIISGKTEEILDNVYNKIYNNISHLTK